ncbi:hypothetical protein ACFQAT_02910 [Undibacterium arcticum]|uniref:hypothetical protein n=1 Tax=Undibacterium arcticum TaxID=1762892 RepID=UPI00360B5446
MLTWSTAGAAIAAGLTAWTLASASGTSDAGSTLVPGTSRPAAEVDAMSWFGMLSLGRVGAAMSGAGTGARGRGLGAGLTAGSGGGGGAGLAAGGCAIACDWCNWAMMIFGFGFGGAWRCTGMPIWPPAQPITSRCSSATAHSRIIQRFEVGRSD